MIRLDIVHVADDGRTETRLGSVDVPDFSAFQQQRRLLRDDRPTCERCDGVGWTDGGEVVHPCPECNGHAA